MIKPLELSNSEVLWIMLIATGITVMSFAACILQSEALMLSGVVGGGFIVVFTLFRRRIVAASRCRKVDIFAPWVAFPVAYVLWFTIGSINLVDVPSTFAFGLFDPIPARMWALYALGLVGYMLGVGCGGQSWDMQPQASAAAGWDYGRSRAVLLGIVSLALISFVIVLAEFGAPALSSNPEEARLALHGPAYQLFVQSIWTTIIFTPVLLWFRKADSRCRWRTYASLGLLAALLSISASRSSIFIPVITVLIARHYAWGRASVRKLTLVLLIVFAVISVGGYARDRASSGDLDWTSQIGIPAPLVPITYTGLYIRYSVGTLRDVVDMIPRSVPYQEGAITFAALKVFLPGRQDPPDIFFKDILARNFAGSGEPATLLGPFYADWGLPGIFLGMLIFGLIYGFVYRAMLCNPTPLRIVVYAWASETALTALMNTAFPFPATITLPFVWYCMTRLMRIPTASIMVPPNHSSASTLEPSR